MYLETDWLKLRTYYCLREVVLVELKCTRRSPSLMLKVCRNYTLVIMYHKCTRSLDLSAILSCPVLWCTQGN